MSEEDIKFLRGPVTLFNKNERSVGSDCDPEPNSSAPSEDTVDIIDERKEVTNTKMHLRAKQIAFHKNARSRVIFRDTIGALQ